VPDEQTDDPQIVSAEGKVIPREYAQLSYSITGLVKSVNADEGEVVQAGDVIASLQGGEQIEANLAAAQMELIAAEQALTRSSTLRLC
jgi:multidrug efflux pump subunit AcrA (membrane-fusion protein)